MREIIASVFRELDRTIKLYVAFLIVRVSSKARAIKDQHCWLIGGSSGKAYTDNGAALHKYIVEHCPHINVYWVINQDSPDVDKARRVGPVLYREALETYVYSLLAQVHVISHGLHDIPGCSSSLTKNAVKVRLGHGLTALKKTRGSLLRDVPAKSRVFDLVPVSSEFEKENKLSWGIDPNKIVVTGLPRCDELVRRRNQRQQEPSSDAPARILYMPTWRDWLPHSPDKLREADFYRHITDFLLHPDLNAFLAERNVFIDVHLHIIMQRHGTIISEAVAGLSNVRLLPPAADLQEAMVDSRLLITDYSSVAWDFLYLDSPVLFYQFDLEQFNQHRGAHVDLAELFGPVARDARQAVELTRHFVETDFNGADYRASMEHWKQKAFKYHDAKNCERTVNAILELVHA